MMSAVKNANESQVDICIPKLVIATYGKDINWKNQTSVETVLVTRL